MALNKYITATQSLLNDPSAQRFPVSSLTTYINTGRSQLALEGECVRFNYGLGGIVSSATFTAGGSTFSYGGPALQETVQNWLVISAAVSTGTTAYQSAPGIFTMSAPALSTGTFSYTLAPPNTTSAGQEAYPLPKNVCLTLGIKDVIGVRGVAVNFGSYGSNIYTLRYDDWTSFQAYYRVYQQLSGNPVIWTRYQDTIFLRPIPSSAYPMNWDCQCSVVDLIDDTTPEAIPYSFTDAIPYFAAYLALMSAQRKDDAKNMLDIYERFTKTGRRNVQSTFVPDIYATI